MRRRKRMSYFEVLKLAKKPSSREIWLFIKLTLIGISLLGLMAFIVRLMFLPLFG